MTTLLVTMSVPKEGITTEDEGHRFAMGRIEILNWERKACVHRVEYRSPPQHLGDGLSVRFTGGCPYRGLWYQTSSTEIIAYRTADWAVERVISHPSFNDLHGLLVEDDGIVLVNTGLEMIQFLTHEGEIVREVNFGGTPTWERFDRSFDYRRIGTTKPHDVHVNHVFRLDGSYWVTRCLRRDAVRLEDHRDRIDIGVGQPHDGILRGDFLYFTTTNAHLVVVNARTRRIEDVLDLNALNAGGGQIGWCRGLEVDGDHAFVGFTRLRRSKWHGAFDTARDFAHGRKRISHIEKVNLTRHDLVDSYDYRKEDSTALFAIMTCDRAVGKIPC